MFTEETSFLNLTEQILFLLECLRLWNSSFEVR